MKKHVQSYLERDLGYKLCFHERDFLVGESIPANIEAAINHSRRMIMIISRYLMLVVLSFRHIEGNNFCLQRKMSVNSYGTFCHSEANQLMLDGFCWNFILHMSKSSMEERNISFLLC